MRKGSHLTLDQKMTQSLSHLGKPMADTTRAAIRKFHLGSHHATTPEARANMSAAHMGQSMSENTRLALLKVNLGSHHTTSAEARAKMVDAWKYRPSFSIETRAKMSISHKGELNVSWKGGVTPMSRKIAADRRNALGPIDRKGFAAKCADLQWVCQLCGKILTPETVTVDHIVPVVRGGTNVLENLQPLCQHCNSVKRDKPMSVVVGSQFLFD